MSEEFNKIAVIGMSGQFPGADSIDEYWVNLMNAKECISEYTDAELKISGIPASTLSNKKYLKVGGSPNYMDCFDAEFFGYSPKEAQLMDPQQRKILEHSWHALEHAGCDPKQYSGVIGVYFGMGVNTYLLKNIINSGNWDRDRPELAIYGNGYDYLSTRVSYLMNLTGPSITLQSACSTSLVSVHQACQSLLTYQTDVALAGGVSVKTPCKSGYLYEQDGIFSSDGHCRVFDAEASGTVFTNGIGVVVLKRSDDAIADGDTIYAVVIGSAVNNDGADKVGYNAPSVKGQSEVVALTHTIADINPEIIQYIEAHGTGTLIGDPIEVKALTKAFRLHTNKKQYCAMGSVKSNIGHLDAAAGIAGFIKVVMSLYHKKIPSSINYQNPNPKIDFDNSPFYVNDKLQEWPENNGRPRCAGISSFGFGGTNAHILLEEFFHEDLVIPVESEFIIPLSAKTKKAMRAVKQNLVTYLRINPNVNLSKLAYTLQTGRQGFAYRTAVVCKNVEEAIEKLINSEDILCETADESSEFANLTNKQIADLWISGGCEDWSFLYKTPVSGFMRAEQLI